MHLPVSPEYLKTALQDGYSMKNIKLVHRPVGDLFLPTGRLVACDPFVFPDAEPFSLSLPRGRFPLVLIIAEIATDERVAFALVHFSRNTPARWEMLSVGSQDISNLKDGEIFGYPVDSGTGCFMDNSAGSLLNDAMGKDPNYYETLTKEMDKTYRHTRSWLDTKIGDANLVAFSSGYGDGSYATYAGFDSDNEISTVVTDFAVLASGPNVIPPRDSEASPRKSGVGRLWGLLRSRK